ncbi:MAG: FG-GAP-like repeat-containing protein [Cytophagaceae bacterium]
MKNLFWLFLASLFNPFFSLSQVKMEAVTLYPMLGVGAASPLFTTNMDVDGDGVLDIICSDNLMVGQIYVMKGVSTGGFSSAVAYDGGAYPAKLTPANINNSGGMDLIIVSPYSDGIYILLNDGTGVFSAPEFYSVGDSPSNAIAGDFNEDGKTDIAVTNNYGYSVSILIGDGTGNFAAAVNYTTAALPNDIAIGDVNKDGHLDLVVAAGNGVSVLIGQGTGVFNTYSQKTITPATSVYGIAIADINNDGNLDLVSAGVGGLYVANGSGTGSFSSFVKYGSLLGQPDRIVCMDLDNDAYLDVIIRCSGINIFMNSGTGTFPTSKTYSLGNGMIDYICKDFDQDGINDILSVNDASRSFGFAKGKGDGSFVAVRSYDRPGDARCVVSADFNNDGNVDMAVSTGDYRIYVYYGGGDGAFTSISTLNPSSTGVVGLVSVDLNIDGKMDLVGCDISTNRLVIFVNNGNGFNSAILTDAGANKQPYSIVSADFNSDGYPDLMTANNSTNGGVSLFLSAGNGYFASPVTFSIGAGAFDLVAADFNGDGKMDIAASTVSSFDSKIAILIGDGAGSFAPFTTYSCVYARGLKAADVNQDGKTDLLVVQKNTPGNIVIFKGNGDGTFGTPDLVSAGMNAQGIVVGNFNSDAFLDIAVTADEGIVFFTNDGQGVFTKNITYGAGYRVVASDAYSNICTQFGLADFNGDGNQDLTIANTGGDVCLMLNNNATREPLTPSSNITFTNLSSESVNINWTSGDGKSRIVIMKAVSTITQLPVDATLYSASNSYGNGSQLEANSFVIYNGAGTSVTVTGLNSNTTYYVAVFEYNGTGTNINYRTSTYATNQIVTLTTSVAVKTALSGTMVYPNPFNESAILLLPSVLSGILVITDILGNEVKQIESINSDKVSIVRDERMPAGIYLYTFISSENKITGKLTVY